MSLDGLRRLTDRIARNYLPGIRERLPADKVPPFADLNLSLSEVQQFCESLITPKTRAALDTHISQLPYGIHRVREIAGTPEDGTRHTHDFVIVKSKGYVELFFIDPEHAMGQSINRKHLPGIKISIPRRGDLRPQVNIIYGTRLYDGDSIPDLAILRYRASAIPENQKSMHKPSTQLEMAHDMLTNGNLPQIMNGKEDEVTFSILLQRALEQQYRVRMQARSAGSVHELEEFMRKGKDPSEGVIGQLERYRSIMRTHFPRLLATHSFEADK